MKKLTDEQRLAVSDEAKRLLGDEVFNGVLSAMVADCIVQLISTVPGSPEGIQAHATLRGLDDIKGRLRALEGDGAVLRKKHSEG